MKKITWLLLIVVIFTGCGKKGEDDKTKQEDNATEDAIEISQEEKDALYDLYYKFTKGEQFTYKLTTITNTNQTVASDTTVTNDVTQTIKYKFIINVLDVDKDNVTTISVNINRIDLSASYDGHTMKYNSEMEIKDEERMNYFEYETMKHTTYQAKLDNRGTISEVSHLDQMIDNLVKIQNYQKTLTEEEKKGISENLSNMLVKPLTQHLFRALPDHEIGIDSVWEFRYPSSLATFAIENIVSFTMLKTAMEDNDKIAEFSASLRVKTSGNNTYTEKGITYIFDTPVVTGSGKVFFNIDKGYVARSKTTTRVETQGIIEAKDANNQTQHASRRDITVSTNIIERL